jgi:hypothetical protein
MSKRYGGPLICLESMPQSFCCDCSKYRGFRCNYSFTQAAISAFDPRQNEFWNVITDILPLCFFFAAMIDTVRNEPSFHAAPTAIQVSLVSTFFFTILQHACSLFAHMFQCVSPRLSHAVWFVDYAGIVLNFMHNAPMAASVVWGISDEKFPIAGLWSWMGVNLAATVPIVMGALKLTTTVTQQILYRYPVIPFSVRLDASSFLKMRNSKKIPFSSIFRLFI